LVIQIITSIFAQVFTTRALLFVLGLVIGGMLTVSWSTYTEWMLVLSGIWQMVADVVMGR